MLLLKKRMSRFEYGSSRFVMNSFLKKTDIFQSKRV